MKRQNIEIIEEKRQVPQLAGVELRFAILFRPDSASMATKLYEKRRTITDSEALHFADKNIIKRIRKDDMMEVFEKFYTENFLKEKDDPAF